MIRNVHPVLYNAENNFKNNYNILDKYYCLERKVHNRYVSNSDYFSFFNLNLLTFSQLLTNNEGNVIHSLYMRRNRFFFHNNNYTINKI